MSLAEIISSFAVILIVSESFYTVQSWHETRYEYLRRRREFVEEESNMRTGMQINLTTEETRANEILMEEKRNEIEETRLDNVPFPPAVHFFQAKSDIEQSRVFQILQTMPKGAVLHVHDSATVDVNWLIRKATYLPDCYMCYNGSQLHFHFFPKPPNRTNNCRWESVNYMRKASHDVEQFDRWLYHNMTLFVRDPFKEYPSQLAVWSRFQSIFTALSGLVFYAPVFKAHFRQTLQTFYDDNALYVEVRALLPPVYELDGTLHDRRWVVQTYREIAQSFQKQHRDFMGAKIIFTSSRNKDVEAITYDVMEAMELHTEFPDFVVGYDLVGQEDTGRPLSYFMSALLLPSQQTPPIQLPYFFHAGETDWNLEDVDDNLIDAILLNTSRIGHGFALLKHPKVLDYVKKKGIAIEVNPISNQVLRLVDNLQDHPATVFLAAGVPMVVSCDDPALWDAKGVSYDWYEMFMGIAGATDDLRLLKKLAMDSIRYSAMSDAEKSHAMAIWQEKWKQFIHRANKRV